MKMKTFLVAALAITTLAACSKDGEPAAPVPAAKTNFAVSLPGALETYAVEDPQAAGQITPFYSNVVVYLIDAGNNAVGYSWSDDEIKAKQKRFEQVVEPSKVIVIANTGSVSLLLGNVQASSIQNSLDALAVADQNQAAKTLAAEDAKGNAAGSYSSVQQVTLVGEQTVFTTETPDDGHMLKKAAVELKSLVSRFEAGTLKAGTGLDALTVEAVYINYFYNENGKATTQQFSEVTWPASFTPAWATDAYSADVTSAAGTKAYAYQVFSGTLIPHIIYKVSGTVSAGHKLADGTGDLNSPTPFTGRFITVKGFRESGTLLASIDAHKIYKMGLENGGIEITPDKITDKPEKQKIDLLVAITVADWTVGNVVPEI